MKKLILFLTVAVGGAFAQSNPAFSVTAAADPYTNRICNDVANIGSMYTDITAVPSVTWVCQKSSTGAIGWVQSFVAVVGGGGSLSVASGKTLTASKTLTLTGTDGTTETFPSTSATIARTDSAQTFTGVQTLSSTPVLSSGAASFNGKVLTVSNALTLAGTDSTTMTFPSTSATIARTDAANTFTGIQTLSSAPVFSTGTLTNTGTESLPSNTGGIPVVIACGATSGGTANCANTATGHTAQVYGGVATLASNASVITISPGFTATGDYSCVGNDVTTRANPVQVVPTSATSFTITNTTGASDVVNWVCVGY